MEDLLEEWWRDSQLRDPVVLWFLGLFGTIWLGWWVFARLGREDLGAVYVFVLMGLWWGAMASLIGSGFIPAPGIDRSVTGMLMQAFLGMIGLGFAVAGLSFYFLQDDSTGDERVDADDAAPRDKSEGY